MNDVIEVQNENVAGGLAAVETGAGNDSTAMTIEMNQGDTDRDRETVNANATVIESVNIAIGEHGFVFNFVCICNVS